MAMTDPLIMVAPNGARRGKADHPALPVTLAETVAAARACHAAGAAALHLHVRDAAGGHSLDPGRYREALAELVRVVPAMRVQITTEAAGRYTVADQHACLRDLRPGWASVAIREIARDAALAPGLYALCADQGIEVQHILHEAADIVLLTQWLARGIVPPGPVSVLLVLGRYDPPRAGAPQELAPRLALLPPGARWMVCAFGAAEHACLRAAARAGGDCRVGFENGLEDAGGRRWADNAASVAALRASLKEAA